MDNIRNIEVINITTQNGHMIATLSFQDMTKILDTNNGYDHIEVAVNLRDIQLSAYGNVLVNQSVRPEPVAIANTTNPSTQL